MRIAFLSPSGELGGAERCLLDLVASVRAADARSSLLVIATAEGPLVSRLSATGVETAVVPLGPALERAGEGAGRFGGGPAAVVRAGVRLAGAGIATAIHARRLAAALRRFDPDVIHSNGVKHHVVGALLPRGRAALVWHVRDLPGERPLAARALRAVRGRADGVVAISRMVAEDVRRTIPGARVEVVHDAIDVEEFSPGPAEGARLDALAGMAPAGDVVRIGLVATYARWKGQDVFLEAAAELLERAPDARIRFYVAGGPIYRTRGSQFGLDELRSAAARGGLGDRVGFVPFQSDPAWLFRTLDVVVHASTRPEPFGRTIAEAMACGKALVATRTSGATELIQEDRDALLVPPGDPRALAAALAVLVRDPRRRAGLGAAARAASVPRFGRARLGPELLAAYARLGVPRGQAGAR